MSTTGNEYEEPETTPTAPPAQGEPAPDSQPAGTWNESPPSGDAAPQRAAGSEEEPAVPAGQAPATGAAATGPSDGALSGEPSHEAVGIGVVDAPDHHGHDEGRDTMTVSQAQNTPGALGSEQEQRLPAMSQNNASDLEKVTGIVAQTRQDIGTEPVERIAEVLQQRLDQAGIELPESDVHELARQVSTGDAHSPDAP